jgi:hypothetical protein
MMPAWLVGVMQPHEVFRFTVTITLIGGSESVSR